MTVQYLTHKNKRLAYVKTEGAAPGVIFCGGFRSDMTGVKAVALEEFCVKRGQQFIRFDYSGHGQSSGDFTDGCISDWKDDAQAVLMKLTTGRQVLVGSSMGGWISLLIARDKPKKVAAIVTLACAPDFTENMVWDKLTQKQKETLAYDGVIHIPSEYGGTYPITRKLIEDGRENLILGNSIDVNCPVHLIHGMKDDDVPWEYSMSVNEKLTTRDVKTTLMEKGNHRLSEPEDLARMSRILELMLVKIK